MPDCQVRGCDKGTQFGRPLCPGCDNRHRASGLAVEAFMTIARPGAYRNIGQTLCKVPQCERPRHTIRGGLCDTHLAQWVRLGRSWMDRFVEHPSVGPLPGFGGCRVAACYRLRNSGRLLDRPNHQVRLNRARRTAPSPATRRGGR